MPCKLRDSIGHSNNALVTRYAIDNHVYANLINRNITYKFSRAIVGNVG